MNHFFTLLVGLVILLGGCSHNRTDPTRAFAVNQPIESLAGVYQNRAQSSQPQARPVYLSAIIWRGVDLAHADIETIEVVVLNAQTLQVSAMGREGMIRTDRFFKGQHFEIQDGVLEIKPQAGVAGLKSGEPMIGVYSEKMTLGLDTRGQGKVRQQTQAAGLAMGLIPIAMSATEDLRFVKIN